MDWLSVILRLVEKFLGWKEAEAQEAVATVGDRRQAAAEAKALEARDEAERRIKQMADALAGADAARRRGDNHAAREFMATVERLQRERDRAVPLGV